jgi:hypothetical protein
MPMIVMLPHQIGVLDGSVKKQAFSFLQKLAANNTSAGLHLEPIHHSADSRVRTGRVNDFYRAILFNVHGHGAEACYVIVGVLPHDEAIAYARRARLPVGLFAGLAALVNATVETSSPR